MLEEENEVASMKLNGDESGAHSTNATTSKAEIDTEVNTRALEELTVSVFTDRDSMASLAIRGKVLDDDDDAKRASMAMVRCRHRSRSWEGPGSRSKVCIPPIHAL